MPEVEGGQKKEPGGFPFVKGAEVAVPPVVVVEDTCVPPTLGAGPNSGTKAVLLLTVGTAGRLKNPPAGAGLVPNGLVVVVAGPVPKGPPAVGAAGAIPKGVV